jgi:hypothetical protein
MGIMRPVQIVTGRPVANNGTTEIDLPRSTVYKDLFLVVNLNYDIGVANGVLHEDGLSRWLNRVAIIAQGLPVIFDMDGFSAKMLAEYQSAVTLIADVAPVAFAAGIVARLHLPITFMLRDANNEFTTLFDARGLPELKLRLETSDFATTVITPGGGGSVTFNSANVDVLADFWDTADAIAGEVMETRRAVIGATQTTTGNQGKLGFDLLKGGLFRGALLIARTAATTGRTDARPSTVSIRRNVGDMIVDTATWFGLQLRMTYDQPFVPPTGVLYLSLDPEGALHRDALLDTARVPGAQESLALETVIGTASVFWTIVPEYLIVRGR